MAQPVRCVSLADTNAVQAKSRVMAVVLKAPTAPGPEPRGRPTVLLAPKAATIR